MADVKYNPPPESVLKKYDFSKSDLRNFLILLAAEFKRRELELIPDGLILKEPKWYNGEGANTYVDMIGIPFKKVYGRTRVFYSRIRLSEFAKKYERELGTGNRPMRLKILKDMNLMHEQVKNRLSVRLDIPLNRFILEFQGETENLLTYRFKFKIEKTDFTTEDSGFCLSNDVGSVPVYVAEPNVQIQNGIAKIALEDKLQGIPIQSSSVAHLNSADQAVIRSTDPFFPEEFKIQNLSNIEMFSVPPKNEVVKESFGSYVTGNFGDYAIARIRAVELITPYAKEYNAPNILMGIKADSVGIVRSTLDNGQILEELIPSAAKGYNGTVITDPIKSVFTYATSSYIEEVSLKFWVKMLSGHVNMHSVSTHSSSNVLIEKWTQYKVKDISLDDRLTIVSTHTTSSRLSVSER